MVPAGFFAKFKMRRMARRYATQLPRLLMQDYGGGEIYTDAQITACVRRAKLPKAGLRLARAAYLPEPEFTQKYGADYALLHQLFEDSLPSLPAQEIGNAADSNNASIYPGGFS